MTGSYFENAARVFCGIVLASLLPCRAETSLSNVLVHQRWPWSEKVDVDFTLTGEAADIDVSARWDGLADPVVLGTVFGPDVGHNRFTWDPAASPWAGKTLMNFTVSLAPAAADAHTYLAVDLQTGGVSHLAEPDGANGAWSAAYKTTKMVFRRIPAGTYTLGEPQATFDYLGQSASDAETYYKICGTRTVTFTHDFYVGVFRCTTAQLAALSGGSEGGDTCPVKLTYETLRGGRTADGIDWPNTRYDVSPTSVVARLRAKAGSAFTIDLCEDEQWEVAARAGTTTFWPTGGTTSESYDTLSNEVDRICAWRGNGYSYGAIPVGEKAPNAWGLYDVIGGGTAEWVLDSSTYFNSKGTLPNSQMADKTFTDPVGGHSSKTYRIYRSHSGFGATTTLFSLLISSRRASDPSTQMGVRFCIHLKPLKFVE